MTKTVRLKTPLKRLDKLHKATETRSKYIQIEKQDLINLLLDHSKIYSLVNECPLFNVLEPGQRRKIISRK